MPSTDCEKIEKRKICPRERKYHLSFWALEKPKRHEETISMTDVEKEAEAPIAEI